MKVRQPNSERIELPAMTRRRKVLFSLLLGVLVAVAVEVISYVGVFLIRGQRFSPARSAANRQWIVAQAHPGEKPSVPVTARSALSWCVIHPYAGFVANPDIDLFDVDRDGFRNSRDWDHQDGDFRIGFFGGSVARGLSGVAGEMVKELGKSPQLQGRRIIVRNFALAGYKQPQQLIILNYFLSLGEPLDVVVNVDGVNEVAGGWAENFLRGIFPFYPNRWPQWLVGATGDLTAQRLIGKIAYLRERRARTSRLCSSVLRYSPTCELLWRGLDSSLSRQITAAQEELSQATSVKRSFRTHGPELHYESQEEVFSALVENWRRSSLLMHQLCLANGIRYYHFLQPNQYVPHSKPLGPEEKRIAISPDPSDSYRKAVELGYPRLAVAGEELVSAGVRFHDLRMLFSGVSEPLYQDVCCHFNRRGKRIVVQEITRAIMADVAGESAERPLDLP